MFQAASCQQRSGFLDRAPEAPGAAKVRFADFCACLQRIDRNNRASNKVYRSAMHIALYRSAALSLALAAMLLRALLSDGWMPSANAAGTLFTICS